MKVLIIEDEPLALERIKTMLLECITDAEIVGEEDSVESTLHWFQTNAQPDVILSDIQLGDGTCFELFQAQPPTCPVIFITAFQEHAIQAFQVNAVDYLLKPLKKDDLQRALQKIQHRNSINPSIDYSKLAKAILQEEQKFNKRYLIRFGEHIRTITTEDIAYVYTTMKAVFFVTHTGKEYPYDKSLDSLEKELDPKKFFRINRQFIVSFQSIGQMHPASKSRVQLELNPVFKGEDVVVSTEKSPVFKEWLGLH